MSLQDNIPWDTIELLSLDIFDTLLFRAVAEPSGIFSICWEKAMEKGENKITLSPEEFRKLRIEMERRARNKAKNREIHFEDIYREMPAYMAWDMEKLKNTEYETEQEYCYFNREILELALKASAKGKKVVLLSDMYFTPEEIKEILQKNGVNTTLFDEILISCEYGCNKQNGELYEVLRSKYPKIEPSHMLHIGDNQNSDYSQAKKHGLQAVLYSAIPAKMYDIYEYERIRHNTPLPQILSLRKAAVCQNPCEENQNKKRRRIESKKTSYETGAEIGASILGPFLTLYCSFIVDRMEALGIHRIYPLMREGYLLGELLKKEIANRGLDFTVKPIYISRKVTYLPAIHEINREEIENMIGARNLTIREAIALMGLDGSSFQEFAPYYEERLKVSHTIKMGDSTLKELFIQKMLRPENKKKMEAFIRKQRKLLNTYLKQEIGDFVNVATADIGFFGRIQMWLEESLHLEGMTTDFTHFLGIGITGNKVMDGIHFEGYGSTMTENADLVTTIHRTTDVLEKLISVTEGSTIGYQETESGQIEPIKGNPVENPILAPVFKGIFSYQSMWFDFSKRKPALAKQAAENPREALMILHRLIDMPRKAEAELFTNMQADTNFGTNYAESVITKKNITLLKEKGADYIDKCNVSYTYENSNVVWPKGLITLEDEFYYVRRALKEKSQNEIMKSMQNLVEQMQEEGVRDAALYGAGENGRQFYAICRLYGIKVTCFIDRKESLWGTQKEGIPVMGLQEALEKGNTVFLITSLFSVSEIRAYIEEQALQKNISEKIYCV